LSSKYEPGSVSVVDAREHGARRIASVVEVELLEHATDHGLLIGVVVDDEVAPEPGRLVVAAQQPHAGRVERADPQVAHDVAADEPLEPLAHLARRLVRERDGEDAVRRHAERGDEVGDAVGDDARLAAPRASEDEQRPFGAPHRASLRLVQLGREGRLLVHGCSLAPARPGVTRERATRRYIS
jgi:hypothetical protein